MCQRNGIFYSEMRFDGGRTKISHRTSDLSVATAGDQKLRRRAVNKAVGIESPLLSEAIETVYKLRWRTQKDGA
jgi:hypothetical protein